MLRSQNISYWQITTYSLQAPSYNHHGHHHFFWTLLRLSSNLQTTTLYYSRGPGSLRPSSDFYQTFFNRVGPPYSNPQPHRLEEDITRLKDQIEEHWENPKPQSHSSHPSSSPPRAPRRPLLLINHLVTGRIALRQPTGCFKQELFCIFMNVSTTLVVKDQFFSRIFCKNWCSR